MTRGARRALVVIGLCIAGLGALVWWLIARPSEGPPGIPGRPGVVVSSSPTPVLAPTPGVLVVSPPGPLVTRSTPVPGPTRTVTASPAATSRSTPSPTPTETPVPLVCRLVGRVLPC